MRVPTDNLLPDPGSQPDATSIAMAAAVESQRRFDPQGHYGDQPIKPTQTLKAFIEKARDDEENPDVTKYRSRIIEPGERAPDRERAPGYERDLRRL